MQRLDNPSSRLFAVSRDYVEGSFATEWLTVRTLRFLDSVGGQHQNVTRLQGDRWSRWTWFQARLPDFGMDTSLRQDKYSKCKPSRSCQQI